MQFGIGIIQNGWPEADLRPFLVGCRSPRGSHPRMSNFLPPVAPCYYYSLASGRVGEQSRGPPEGRRGGSPGGGARGLGMDELWNRKCFWWFSDDSFEQARKALLLYCVGLLLNYTWEATSSWVFEGASSIKRYYDIIFEYVTFLRLCLIWE